MLKAAGFVAKKAIAAFLLPPFGPLFAMLLGAVLVERARFSGRFLFLGGALVAFALSLPVVADWSQWPFEERFPPIKEIPVSAQAIVVLGGGRDLGAQEWGGETVSGATLERLRYAAWLSKLSHRPILVSGGMPGGGRHAEAYWMAQILSQDYGVTARWQEDQSNDTTENARMSQAILGPAGIASVILVTDVVHMPRAIDDFTTAGLKPIAAPIGFNSRAPRTFMSFLPDPGAYMRSSASLHEALGIAWQQIIDRTSGLFS